MLVGETLEFSVHIRRATLLQQILGRKSIKYASTTITFHNRPAASDIAPLSLRIQYKSACTTIPTGEIQQPHPDPTNQHIFHSTPPLHISVLCSMPFPTEGLVTYLTFPHRTVSYVTTSSQHGESGRSLGAAFPSKSTDSQPILQTAMFTFKVLFLSI